MFDNFEKLPEDKKKKIIDVCIEEFAEYGYEKSSTNRIVEKAGISKGILFHYFKSKKKLFLYIFDFVIDYYMDKIKIYKEKINTNDLFERLVQWGLIKINIFLEEPVMYEMFAKTYLSIPKKIENEIYERLKHIKGDGLEIFLEDIDMSRFREDINFDKAIELLLTSIETLSEKYIQQFKGKEIEMIDEDSYIDMIESIQEYMDLLKWGFYKS